MAMSDSDRYRCLFIRCDKITQLHVCIVNGSNLQQMRWLTPNEPWSISSNNNNSQSATQMKKNKHSPIAKKMSFTFIAVFADVSMKSSPFSSAYSFASSNSTTRKLDKSALLPAKAITMFGEAFKVETEHRNNMTHNNYWWLNIVQQVAWLTCRCNSFTQVLARWKLSWFWMSYTTMAACAPR